MKLRQKHTGCVSQIAETITPKSIKTMQTSPQYHLQNVMSKFAQQFSLI
uniref:Uncharacterized protein n=1 Tax=Rhizophora mucronata TaxID=61149 RepID=A0A2P2NCH9_RHIMU